MVVRTRHPEIRTRRVEPLRFFQRSLCVTRLLSNPRHVAASPEAQGTLPDDAKERLRKSLQPCLRQTLLRLVTVLDISEVGITRLLTVPLTHLHTLVPSSTDQGLACAEQWAALAKSAGARTLTQRRRDLVVSGMLHYEPNVRVQALPTVVHRPAESVVLRCTECSHPMSSSWYFVHSRTGEAKVLTPMSWTRAVPQAGHNQKCDVRSEHKDECIMDNFDSLDFCEHTKKRTNCAQCGGICCVHGKQRHTCSECDHLVKRRKK